MYGISAYLQTVYPGTVRIRQSRNNTDLYGRRLKVYGHNRRRLKRRLNINIFNRRRRKINILNSRRRRWGRRRRNIRFRRRHLDVPVLNRRGLFNNLWLDRRGTLCSILDILFGSGPLHIVVEIDVYGRRSALFRLDIEGRVLIPCICYGDLGLIIIIIDIIIRFSFIVIVVRVIIPLGKYMYVKQKPGK
jgi:hypothetical protein